MFGSFGQFAATTQFYLYGKSRCTQTGWEKARKAYPQPDILEDPNLNLSENVYMITGANAGIGREITQFVASKGATVFMICRNPERAEASRSSIMEITKNERIHVLLGDCGLEEDIRRIWKEFLKTYRTTYSDRRLRLDGLICNAGALLNHKTFTSEGVEITFATHLLFGTYLLTTLALDVLQSTPESRVVAVSSGGMYNTKFPSWDIATSTGSQNYDGQFAYAYAKRGQVLLCERWAEMYDRVKFFSSHPGWTQTEALDAAYGESKRFLEPLRTTWQGAEGIIWLAVAPTSLLQNGGFYLDRTPQVKHIAGPFFSEGTYTKNSREEVDMLFSRLQEWSSWETRPTLEESQMEAAKAYPLTAMTRAIDIQKFMGTWYVLGHIPTFAEVGSSNGAETYTWDEEKQRIRILFQYIAKGAQTTSELQMRGTIKNMPINTHWGIDPRVFGVRIPLGMDYLLLDLAEDGSWCMVGVPDRSYLWIMTRTRPSAFDEYRSAMEVYDISFIQIDAVKRRRGEQTDADTSGVPQLGRNSLIAEGSSAFECEVMLLALRKAVDLGYDPTKVIRVPWTNPGSASTISAGSHQLS
jgi:dehydrogenase/reductase SDR family protein 12